MAKKLTEAERRDCERVIALAKKANEVGTCFGMTAKTTRLFERLYELVKEQNAV